MHDLLQRVDTGISASGRRRMDRMIGDTAKRAFERRLQRLLSGQRLPATIAGAAIFDAGGVARHSLMRQESRSNSDLASCSCCELRSEAPTSALQTLMLRSYSAFFLHK